MRLAWQLVRENRRYIAWLVGLSTANGLVSALLISTVTRALTPRPAHSVIALGSLFVGLCIAIIGCRHAHRYVVAIVSNRLELTLRDQLAEVTLSCGLRELERRRSSDLMAVLTRDVETVSGFVLSLPTLLSNLALLLGALCYLAWLSGYGLLLGLAGIVIVGTVLHARIVVSNMPLFHRIRDHYATLLRTYRDLAFGAAELRMDEAMSRRLLQEHIGPEARAIANLNMRAVHRHSLGLNVAQATLYCLLGVVVFVYPLLSDVSSQVISAYVIVVLYALGPAESIANVQPLLHNARVALAQIESLQAELSQHREGVPTNKAVGRFETLQLANITFAYPRAPADPSPPATLGPITLRICAGDTVFLTGGNGSGKTTLAKLICGLYVPDGGILAANGSIVDAGGLGSYRGLFSVSFSDSHLPHAARDPTAVATPWTTHLATSLGISELLERFANLELEDLSSGQRRRLGLFFAVARRRDLYVFDEPCANLDPETRAWFYRRLLPELHAAGATLIVISHDDPYYDVASRLLLMRDGRIVSEASPASTVARTLDRSASQSPR